MTSISCLPNSNHLTIYSDTGRKLAVTGQVITGRILLAKLSTLLIDNKAVFNLPSHTDERTPWHRHTQQKHDYKGYINGVSESSSWLKKKKFVKEGRMAFFLIKGSSAEHKMVYDNTGISIELCLSQKRLYSNGLKIPWVTKNISKSHVFKNIWSTKLHTTN